MNEKFAAPMTDADTTSTDAFLFSGLRIGLVGPLPPPSGGMANQTRQLAELLGTAGALVTLIQVNAPYTPAWAGKIKGVRALFRLLPYLAHLWQASQTVDLFHIMANSGWSWHLYAAPAIWIAWLRGKPVVINYRGGEAANFLSRSWLWVKPSLKRTQAIIVPSGFLRHVFEEFGVEAKIVPNIINLERFSWRSRSVKKNTAPHIIVTRNLEPIYDVATAIRAFLRVSSKIPAANLTIAGSGPERDSLEKLVAELDLLDRVRFTGRLENEAMAALYQQADLMVNSSLIDNMPNSVLEALASNVPVVSTNVGGVPFLVEHGHHALLVPPQDPDAMASAMLVLLENADMTRQFGENGLELVCQYAWPQVCGKLFAVYQDVLNKHVTDTVTSQHR
ncbi:glycosyltransferase family 4 protein [Nitrosomonas mobilis]|uniref:Glycosyl transferase, group 1 n=1 Tax=Nitrosomonas mobilis TaxID=51642 RepID=A0A1G5SGS4_9PROT|nr:glycosyltransferase family 4 protein [Nitrosomonas mobilis]SCZ86312.1 Glycosyl transferase, group 1 [Nitrosomonas mobilis]HNO74017.1 glycosyltransferase family 4 protein [Nitrosomonas mobilis]